jgi:hypothetical protein
LEERQNKKSELKRGCNDMTNDPDDDWEGLKTQTSERKHGNRQKRRGHRNKSSGNEENQIERREAFEAAGKLTNATERAAQSHGEPKGTEN